MRKANWLWKLQIEGEATNTWILTQSTTLQGGGELAICLIRTWSNYPRKFSVSNMASRNFEMKGKLEYNIFFKALRLNRVMQFKLRSCKCNSKLVEDLFGPTEVRGFLWTGLDSSESCEINAPTGVSPSSFSYYCLSVNTGCPERKWWIYFFSQMMITFT